MKMCIKSLWLWFISLEFMVKKIIIRSEFGKIILPVIQRLKRKIKNSWEKNKSICKLLIIKKERFWN